MDAATLEKDAAFAWESLVTMARRAGKNAASRVGACKALLEHYRWQREYEKPPTQKHAVAFEGFSPDEIESLIKVAKGTLV